MNITDWLRERQENAERLAATKSGTDRGGWLEDAAYFREAADVCSYAGQLHGHLAAMCGWFETLCQVANWQASNAGAAFDSYRAARAALARNPEGALAQPGRAPACHAEGQGIEAPTPRHPPVEPLTGQKPLDDLVFRLRERARIRRQIETRKSVQEGRPDRIADLLDEAAAALEVAPRVENSSEPPDAEDHQQAPCGWNAAEEGVCYECGLRGSREPGYIPACPRQPQSEDDHG